MFLFLQTLATKRKNSRTHYFLRKLTVHLQVRSSGLNFVQTLVQYWAGVTTFQPSPHFGIFSEYIIVLFFVPIIA